MKTFILLSLTLICTCIYLFVQAPPPLTTATVTASKDEITSRKLFEIVNEINAHARKIYTSRIVGKGKKNGFRFGEDWQEKGVDEGPLPALFLREVSKELERQPIQLGLSLGSDNPINPSNNFKGQSLDYYREMTTKNGPVFRKLEGYGSIAMFPDIASAKPCVVCHNEHKDSPKKDWKLNDIMGATIWTWPSDRVSAQELQGAIVETYAAIGRAYWNYLTKTKTFLKPPNIGEDWPESGSYSLPSETAFMNEVIQTSAPNIIRTITSRK